MFAIKLMRERAGLSQQQVADILGIKKARYGDWERETTMINLREAVRLADLFHCTLDELAGREWHPSIPYADSRQAELNRCWESLDRERQDRLIGTAHDMEAAKKVGHPSAGAQAQAG